MKTKDYELLKKYVALKKEGVEPSTENLTHKEIADLTRITQENSKESLRVAMRKAVMELRRNASPIADKKGLLSAMNKIARGK